MKKHALAAALVLAMAVAAEAQITVTYTRQTSNSRLTVRFSAASYSGYGYGYGYGGSSFAGIGYGGYGYAYGGYGGYLGSVRHAVAPGVVAGAYHPGLVGYGYGYPGNGYLSGATRPIMDYFPGAVRDRQVPERSPENVASALLDQARKRLKIGDYRGAVEDIRSAVVEDEGGGTSEAWFAVALAITGDGRNADKALRAALEHGFKGTLDVQLRHKKEEARIVSILSKAVGEGATAAAYALSLLGQPEKLEKLAVKDVSLKALLPPEEK